MILKYRIKEVSILLDFLKSQGFSRKQLIAIKNREGHIHVNGLYKPMNTMLQINDEVEIQLPKEIYGRQMQPEPIPLNILFEDDYFIVINKPSGLICAPNSKHLSNTLANGLIYHYQKQGLDATVHLISRLDKDTSGLILIAKNGYLHHIMSNLDFKLQRKYLAYVEGSITSDGVIELPIKRVGKDIKRIVSNDGQSARTDYQVLKNNDKYSLLECTLHTGRTHQIRVHLSSIGHPIIGDTLYGGAGCELNRQLLHSYSLSFFHPILNQTLSFETEDPFILFFSSFDD